MKSFGHKSSRAERRAREQFELYVEVGGEQVRHEFTCSPKTSANDFLNVARAEREPALGMSAIRNMIRRSLVDDDGVPAGWRPDPLDEIDEDTHVPSGTPGVVESGDAWPERAGQLAPTSRAGGFGQLPPGEHPADWFKGSDGLLYAMTDEAALEKFTAREAGSSRRRWDHLMDRDDESVIQMEDLMEIVRWLAAQASERPTGR